MLEKCRRTHLIQAYTRRKQISHTSLNHFKYYKLEQKVKNAGDKSN
jgi:hypothetical protein